jgi:NADH:ubiquinone oxidoreductase subunit F (NADH-binding)
MNKAGYQALSHVVRRSSPREVIDIIKQSGLRGCGGAGFPTGNKWQFVAQVNEDPKYIVCNADEGEPGTFKDRIILEQDPHLLIEGMAIAGFAIGAENGYVYLRGEYSKARQRLLQALEEARNNHILGQQIMGSQVNFDIRLRRGAGSYICGEETALLESLEGKRGIPRLRPPYPTTIGLWGKPTLINNVETLARVPAIIRDGAEWYRSLGIGDAAGTKVYCISGHITNPGAYELPMGITAHELIYDHGGGIPEDKDIKAFFPGGLSSGVLPASMTHIKLDYDSLTQVGSLLGSGAMIVMDDSVCMVDVALRATKFFTHESCGECTPCRIGTQKIFQTLDHISTGQASWHDVAMARELALRTSKDSRCGLGQVAAKPFLTTLAHFTSEYKVHIEQRQCPCGVCFAPSARIEEVNV